MFVPRYVFGGSTNTTFDEKDATDTGYLDVFVLSMPAFTWFRANASSDARRSNHFCQDLGGGQMLVIGGREPSDDALTGWTNVDPWTLNGNRGMHIFDMSMWAWTGSYSPNARYQRPTVVQQHYASQ
jgi:hypothetical protein